MSDLRINDCFFHSIIHGEEKSLKVIKGILGDKAIRSPKSLGVKARFGCHKEDDICLSKVTKEKNVHGLISCFDLYLPRLTTFIIDKNVKNNQRIIKPNIVPVDKLYKYKEGTATNLYDEYRTKEDIPLDYVKGICIPYNNLVEDPVLFMQFLCEDILMAYYNGELYQCVIEQIRNEQTNDKAKKLRIDCLEEYIKKVKKLLVDNDTEIPIYNYDNRKFILR